MLSSTNYNNPKLDEKTRQQLFILFVEEEINTIKSHLKTIDDCFIILRTEVDELKKKLDFNTAELNKKLEHSKRLPKQIKKILKR